MYIILLSAIIDSHYVIHHSFADDLQLLMTAQPDVLAELFHSLQSCIGDAKTLATANMLLLNDKTELMLVTSKRTKHHHNLPTSITSGNAPNSTQTVCKEIGFNIRLSSYYECTCLQHCSDMLP